MVEPVQPQDLGRLAGDIERLGGGELHPGGQLVALDPAVQPVVAGSGGGVVAVQAIQQRDARGITRRGLET